MLQTDPFTHKRFYTQTLLHTYALTHRGFYTQRLLHRDPFTHRSFDTHRPLYTQIYLQRNAFTQRRFYIETSSHRDVAACFFLPSFVKPKNGQIVGVFVFFEQSRSKKLRKKKRCFLTPRKPGAFWSQLVGLSRLAGRQLKGPSGIKGKRPFLAKSWPKPFGASF